MSIQRSALFASFFFEALKPQAVSILEAGCAIADSLVSASTRVNIQTSEHSAGGLQNKTSLE